MAAKPVDNLVNTLLQTLEQTDSASLLNRLIVAYSGGRDSHVLLDALMLARERGLLPTRYQLLAVYVNHGLSPLADSWAEHCRRVCERYQLDFKELVVNAGSTRGESPEARARQARYDAFAEFMVAGDALLTAHHQDDQAETLLLQLLRGAGPKGLAAMPVCSKLARGCLLRPLLAFPREHIEDYAEARNLQWVEDDSNADLRYDRNYLRRQLMPLIKQRWPSCVATLSRSARLCAEADHFIDAAVHEDFLRARVSNRLLKLDVVLALDETRRAYVLRHWIHQAGFVLPSYRQLRELEKELLYAKDDANPVVRWQGAECRRYQGKLYLLRQRRKPDNTRLIDWLVDSQLQLPEGGVLRAELNIGRGLAVAHLQNARVQVGFRRGGEQIQPSGHRHRYRLKKLLQSLAVPPWQRSHLPLVYINGRLAAVAHYYVAREFAAGEGEKAYDLMWEFEGE